MTTTHTQEAPRSQAKREQIRQGARQAFLQYGYARASTELLAKAAGVSKPTLYSYYPGKEALLADVLGQFFADIVPPDLPAHLHTSADFLSVLEDLAVSLLERIMHSDYIGLLRVIVSEAPHHPELSSLFQSTVPVHAMGAVKTLLSAAQERSLIPASDLDAASRLFVGSLLTYTILDGLFVVDGPPKKPSRERLHAVVTLLGRALT
ncbi:TetR/AcrR family transcriptional regulator [Deinococcus sp.]|uniref:TetR/AcrR family transcriptional regulator n=1 Tax=Deinococcus sp. TaxID=47478 RepID=UPI003B59F435